MLVSERPCTLRKIVKISLIVIGPESATRKVSPIVAGLFSAKIIAAMRLSSASSDRRLLMTGSGKNDRASCTTLEKDCLSQASGTTLPFMSCLRNDLA